MKLVLVIAFILIYTASRPAKVDQPIKSLNKSLDTLAVKSDQLLLLTQKLK